MPRPRQHIEGVILVGMRITPNTYLWHALSARADVRDWTPRARQDLSRYYALLERELFALGELLTDSEWQLIVDALNGVRFTHETWRLLPDEVEEAIRLDRLDRRWSVDGAALLSKLRALCPGQTLALLDAVERFWERSRAEPLGATDGGADAEAEQD